MTYFIFLMSNKRSIQQIHTFKAINLLLLDYKNVLV